VISVVPSEIGIKRRILQAPSALIINGTASTCVSRLESGNSQMPRETKLNSDIKDTANLTPDVSRRGFVATASAAAASGFALAQGPARAAIVHTDIASLLPYGNGTLPPGIRSRTVADVNGLTVHILEAGYETSGRPAVLLLHGFPELAYCWRKVSCPWRRPGIM
jgi:hypothetical protein